MTPEEMLKELYEGVLYGEVHPTHWEEGFVTDVYEHVWENDRDLTDLQEEKVEELYDRYFGS